MGTEDFQKVVEDSCDIFLVLWAGIRGINAEFQVQSYWHLTSFSIAHLLTSLPKIKRNSRLGCNDFPLFHADNFLYSEHKNLQIT